MAARTPSTATDHVHINLYALYKVNPRVDAVFDRGHFVACLGTCPRDAALDMLAALPPHPYQNDLSRHYGMRVDDHPGADFVLTPDDVH